jgi:hypothetical protein
MPAVFQNGNKKCFPKAVETVPVLLISELQIMTEAWTDGYVNRWT